MFRHCGRVSASASRQTLLDGAPYEECARRVGWAQRLRPTRPAKKQRTQTARCSPLARGSAPHTSIRARTECARGECTAERARRASRPPRGGLRQLRRRAAPRPRACSRTRRALAAPSLARALSVAFYLMKRALWMRHTGGHVQAAAGGGREAPQRPHLRLGVHGPVREAPRAQPRGALRAPRAPFSSLSPPAAPSRLLLLERSAPPPRPPPCPPHRRRSTPPGTSAARRCSPSSSPRTQRPSRTGSVRRHHCDAAPPPHLSPPSHQRSSPPARPALPPRPQTRSSR